jgi:hypothetical protein
VGVQDNTLEARVQALEAELATMRRTGGSRSRSGKATTHDERPAISESVPAGPPVADRRGVVKLLAASAVGAVAGAAINGQHVAATDTQPILQGEENNGTKVTWIYASDDTALACESDGGYGMGCWGPFGNAWFFPFTEPPHGQPGDIGGLWVDDDGNWWAATADGVDAKWRKLAGPETAGALHLLPSPKRVYDSRPGEPPSIDPKSPLSPNIARSIDPKGNSSGVPTQARGVLITLTIAPLASGGFATVWPSGDWPGTSNANFNAGQPIAATTVVGLGPDAKFLVQSNVSTNVVIDIVGYYL